MEKCITWSGARMAVFQPYTYPPVYIGCLMGYCTTGETKIVDLESVSTVVTIRGFVAQVNAKLVYNNSSSEALQVHFTLPVDESAAMYKFEALLDGRTISAHCMEKKKAEKVYKEAVNAGKTAVLARQNECSSDMLELALGNLPAGSKAELSICLVMELKVQTDGGVSFVLPTVLNPRYCPVDGPNVSHDFASKLGLEKAVIVHKAYTINIKARISGGHEIARVTSHTDSIDVAISEDEKSAEVTQDGGFTRDHDWSLLLYYANPYKTRILRETGDRSATGLMKDDLVMINLFPEIPTNSYSSKNEIIFIIDRSGSMLGEKMQSARATLLLFLKSLPIGCLFNVISFGSTFEALFPKSCAYNEETLAKACALQEKMDGDMGGTEILAPLQSVYSTPPISGFSKQILLISDGEVYNVEQVTHLVGRRAHETRAFAVGIGHGASTALIHGVARAGRGRSEMVIQQDKLQLKVMGLVSSMLQDSVQNFRVACEMEPTSSVKLVPKVPPVIFGGQHLTLYARVPSISTVKALSIMGNIGNTDLNISVKGSDIVSVHDAEMSLHRLAARSQINQWQLDEEEDVAEEMIALSVSSGVVSKLTALVGVDQDGNPVERSRQTSRSCSHREDEAFAQTARVTKKKNKKKQLSEQNSSSRSARSCSGVMFGSGSIRNQNPTTGPTRFGCATFRSPACAKLDSSPQNAAFGSTASTFGSGLFGAQNPPTGPTGFGGTNFGSPACGKLQDSSPQNAAFGSTTSTFGSGLFGAQNPPTGPTGFGGTNFGSPACGKLIHSVREAKVPHAELLHHKMERMEKSKIKNLEENSSVDLLKIVSLQSFDGSWTLQDVSKFCTLSLAQLTDSKPSQNERAWATAVALALLESQFGDARAEWSLLANKARLFISSCGEDVDDLFKKAQSLLAAQQ